MYICSHSHGYIIVPDIVLIKGIRQKKLFSVFLITAIINSYMQGTDQSEPEPLL